MKGEQYVAIDHEKQVEDLCEQELPSKFYGLMQDLIRSQNMLNERAMALAHSKPSRRS